MKIAVAAGVLAVLASGLQTPTSVPYRELGRTVQIVGMFEEPLGTKLTLTGHRFGNSSGPSMMGGGTSASRRSTVASSNSPLRFG